MKILDKVVTCFSYITIVVLFLLIARFFYLDLTAMPHWIHYKSVVPVHEVFDVGENPRFISDRKVNIVSNITWVDTIFCKSTNDNVSSFYSTHMSKNVAVQPTKGYKAVTWRYPYKINEPGTCYLKSNVKLSLLWGITKTQTYEGKKFQVVCDG